MPAQKKLTKTRKTPSYDNFHFLIWGMVLLTLTVSILIEKKLYLIKALSQGSISRFIAPPKSNLVGTLDLQLIETENSHDLKPGQTYTLTINLDTKNKNIVAADAYLNYDPTMIKVISINEGVIFPTHPALDFSASKGLITISGIMPIQERFAGQGVMATILFQPIKTGSTEISFQYEPEETTDSNMVELGSSIDILGSATNLTLTIK
jgi:hypothetical protein